MSLRDLARHRLAIIRGETGAETEEKQGNNVFHQGGPCFTPDKTGFARKSASNEPCFTVSPPKERNSETSLPGAVNEGLKALAAMSCPARVDWDKWRAVVADALRLGRDGWAAQAMALGWTELDLFGCVPDRHGDPAGDGLAVWLDGRRMMALCGTYAVVEDIGGGRSYFNRREAEGAVLLWQLGNQGGKL